MKRREFIKSTSLSTISALVGPSLLLNACFTEEDMMGEPNWVVSGNFDRVLTSLPTVNSNLQLIAQSISAEMLSGQMTSALSYRNGLLGPTIKANKGDTVNVQFQNNLSEKTNIHWHGLILPENMDGHPNDVFASGQSYSYVLPIQQRARV